MRNARKILSSATIVLFVFAFLSLPSIGMFIVPFAGFTLLAAVLLEERAGDTSEIARAAGVGFSSFMALMIGLYAISNVGSYDSRAGITCGWGSA